MRKLWRTSALLGACGLPGLALCFGEHGLAGALVATAGVVGLPLLPHVFDFFGKEKPHLT